MGMGELTPFGVYESAYLHRVADKDVLKKGFIPLRLTEDAVSIGGAVMDVLGGTDESEIKLAQQALKGVVEGFVPKKGYIKGQTSGIVPSNMDDLEDIIDGIRSEGTKKGFNDRYNSVIGGLVVATQFEVASAVYAGKETELVAAFKKRDYGTVDKMLGGGILDGVGERIAKYIITDPELTVVMMELDIQLEEGRFSRDSAEKMGGLIRKLYANKETRDQVAAVNQYYNWALEDKGMVTTTASATNIENAAVIQALGQLTQVIGGGARGQTVEDYERARTEEAKVHVHIVNEGRKEW